MGLFVSAYRQIRKIDCVFDEHDNPIDPKTGEPISYALWAIVDDDFANRADGIQHHCVYSAQARMGFEAGSYRSHNAWRNELAKFAGYPAVAVEDQGSITYRHDEGARQASSGPFHELICFSDCEGCIGATVSAKLAADFAAFDDRATEYETHFEWFYPSYEEWHAAFKMAADAGAVSLS